MNNCTLAGRAGSDANLRYTSSGTAVANFSLAVDKIKKDAGPLWVKVAIWGKQAESLSKFITKGKQVVVSGEIDLQTYEVNGEERKDLTLNANRVTLLGGGKEREEVDSDTDENVPF